jgi:hypothetical protein
MEWFDAERVYRHYWSGDWESARSLAEQLIARAERGASRRPELDGCLVRGWIELAGGDVDSALADAARARDFTREAGDPQNLYPALAFRAHALATAGRRTDAAACADELLGLVRREPSLPSFWIVELAVVLAELGRGGELGDAAVSVPSTPWLEAAQAYVEGDASRAAELCAEIGALPEEAYARLEAARVAAAAGRRAEAEAQAAAAFEFYRRVGAVSYCRAAEALLTSLAEPSLSPSAPSAPAS